MEKLFSYCCVVWAPSEAANDESSPSILDFFPDRPAYLLKLLVVLQSSNGWPKLFAKAYATGLGILRKNGAERNQSLFLSQKVPLEKEQDVVLGLGARRRGIITRPTYAT